MKLGRRRIDRVLALGDLQDAMGRAGDGGAAPPAGPPVPLRLEDGTLLTAITDAGQAVGGEVVRVWQTFADTQSGQFRVLVAPVPEDSGESEAGG